MLNALNQFSSFLFDLVALPRPTQRRVRALTLRRLQTLARPDGTLPYHEAEVRALVWELKYYADSRAAALAGTFLAERLLAEAADSLGKPLLIPVPMHPERRRERGHNQTEVLCEAALKALEVGSGKTALQKVLGGSQTILHDSFAGSPFDYEPNILERIKNTAPQQGLMKHKRLRNVKNAMQIKDPSKIIGRVCVVVDDVSTTGATGIEATRALYKAGAAEVRVVALAHS